MKTTTLCILFLVAVACQRTPSSSAGAGSTNAPTAASGPTQVAPAGGDTAPAAQPPAAQPPAAQPPPAQPPPAVAEGPGAVARAYLELGGRGDLAGARARVVPECQSGPVGDVDAVKMMGARMTLTRVETTVQSQDATDAQVRYTVSGSVHADGGTTTLFGAQVHVQGLNIDNAQQSGTLHLVQQGGGWRVTCR